VHTEVRVFWLACNLVRRVTRAAADRQQVESIVDALRWLRQAGKGERVPVLVVHPHRPGRFDPRVRNRRPKQ
jgi:hypothetical protein